MSRFLNVSIAGIVVLVAASVGSPAVSSPRTRAPAQAPADPASYTLTGRVVRVADGDTFTLRVQARQHQVRMASIDAPELHKKRRQPGQPVAQDSKNALARLIAGKTLSLHCFEHDRYGRDVCDVPLGDGSTANRRQVASGMAWANTEGHSKYMRDPELPRLEKQARQAGLGLWALADPVRPWVWRYQCWKKGRC